MTRLKKRWIEFKNSQEPVYFATAPERPAARVPHYRLTHPETGTEPTSGQGLSPGESIICPVCRESVGHPCLTRDNRLMVEPHKKRLRAEVTAPARTPTPSEAGLDPAARGSSPKAE